MRTCVGCGGRDIQAALLRFQSGEDGRLHLAPVSRREGRSAYLHPRVECWRRFAARRGPVRSLGRGVDRSTRQSFVDVLPQVAGVAGV